MPSVMIQMLEMFPGICVDYFLVLLTRMVAVALALVALDGGGLPAIRPRSACNVVLNVPMSACMDLHQCINPLTGKREK